MPEMDHIRSQAQVLAGLNVIDFTWVIAGPMATRILGGMGADVVKVETATRSEYSQRSHWFSHVNDNKASCLVNIKTAEGQALVRRMVADADVLVENFSGGVMDRLGLGYDDLKAVNPRLIYVCGSGLGRSGPLASCPAYGSLLQAYSGRASVLGEPNIRMEGLGLTTAWTDPVTATWEVAAILAALEERERSGIGCLIDLSMVESTIALLPEMVLAETEDELKDYMASREGAPHGVFHAAGPEDQWIALSVEDDAQWRGFCQILAREDLISTAAYRTSALRNERRSELDQLAREWVATQPAREAEERLLAAGVPASLCIDVAGVLARDAQETSPLFPLVTNDKRTFGGAWTDQDRWRGSYKPAPVLGADNDYVFGTLLNLEPAEIERLRVQGAIA